MMIARICLAAALLCSTATFALAQQKILLSLPGPSDIPFWMDVAEGAREKAGRDVDLIVNEGQGSRDVNLQIDDIEQSLNNGIDAMAVAPVEVAALDSVMDRARAEGVEVIFVIEGDGSEGATVVGTDQVAAGGLAGGHLCQKLEGDGRVAVLLDPNRPALRARTDAVAAAVTACGLTVVTEQPEGPPMTPASALDVYLQQQSDLKGVFAVHDELALAVVEALDRAGRLNDVTVVGFGAFPQAVESIAQEKLSATIAENPKKMGELAVDSALRATNGEDLPDFIDSGATLVTTENAADFN